MKNKILLVIGLVLIALNGVNATNITSCGDITGSGTFDLKNDLTNVLSEQCLSIQASSVILDCHGYTITQATSYPAIETLQEGYLNTITIKNCIINSPRGIRLYDVDEDVLIYNNTITLNNAIGTWTQYGVSLEDTLCEGLTGINVPKFVNITNNFIYGNHILSPGAKAQTGISLQGCYESGIYAITINNNFIQNAYIGIELSDGSGTYITNNTVFNSSKTGILINYNNRYTFITNNSVTYSEKDGILIYGGNENEVVVLTNNSACDNSPGLYFDIVGASGVTLGSGNICNRTLTYGDAGMTGNLCSQFCGAGTGTTATTCQDGTLNGVCSAVSTNKGYRCESGVLQPQAQICGCPSGYTPGTGEGLYYCYQTDNNVNLTCNESVLTLGDVGLINYWLIYKGDATGVRAKITLRDRDLYNSFNFVSNKVCFENVQNPDLKVCVDGYKSTAYFGDEMVKNLAGNFSVSIGAYNSYSPNELFDWIKGGTESYSKQFISEQYCAPYFTDTPAGLPPNLFDYLSPYSYCDNGGFTYELLLTSIMQGTYNQYLIIRNSTNCVKIKLAQKQVNGQLQPLPGINLDDLHGSQLPGDNKRINIPTQVSTRISYLAQNITNATTNASHVCVTNYDYNTNTIKFETLIFHLVENMSAFLDNVHNSSNIIASCQAVKNMTGGYASCELCFNASKNGFYGFFVEYYNGADSQDDFVYGGSLSTGESGLINQSYRIYCSSGGQCTFRNINFSGGSGWLFSYDVNQTYYYHEGPPGTDWTTYLIYALIGVFAIMVFYVIAMMFTKKSK